MSARRSKSKIPGPRARSSSLDHGPGPASQRLYRSASQSRLTATPLTSRHTPRLTNKTISSGSKTPGVSPSRLRQLYTGLDEKEHLPRIKNFVMARDPSYILKPLTINTFVSVCEMLLVQLYGESLPPVTTENYKTELPIRMKQLDYPFTIQMSFLKCPNTPPNFPLALTIWVFLLDIVEPATAIYTGLTGVEEARFMYVGGKEKEALAVLEAAIYAKYDLTQEEAAQINQQLDTDLENVQKEMLTWKERKERTGQRREEQDNLLDEFYSSLQRNSIKLREIHKRISIKKPELEFNRERVRKLADKFQENQEKLAEGRARIQATGRTRKECEELFAELERKRRLIALLRERTQQYEEHERNFNQQVSSITAEIETLIFQHNTNLKLSGLPEHMKSSLHISEKDIRPNDMQRVKQAQENCKQHLLEAKLEEKRVGLELPELNNELFAQQRKEMNMTEEINELQKQFGRTKLKIVELDAERAEKTAQSEEQVVKCTMLKNLLRAAVKKHAHVLDHFNEKKAEIEKYMLLEKDEYLKHAKFVKEQNATYLQLEAEIEDAISKMISEVLSVYHKSNNEFGAGDADVSEISGHKTSKHEEESASNQKDK